MFTDVRYNYLKHFFNVLIGSYCLYMPWRVHSWPFNTCLSVCRPLQKGKDGFTDVLCTVHSEIHMPGREGPYIKPIAQ